MEYVAIGVVANAFEFIDFVESVVSKMRELHQSASGTLAEYDDLKKITDDLGILSGRLQLPEGPTDPVLESLCSRCAEVVGEMSVALEAFAIKKNCFWPQIWGIAARSVWKKEKLQAFERRVAGFRQELILRVIVDLGARIDLLATKEQFQQLSETLKHEPDHISEALRENESATNHAEEQHKETRTIIADENQRANKKLLDTFTDLASAQDQSLSTNVEGIYAKIDSASESLLSKVNMVGEVNREEMKQQFMELRRSIEKVREAYQKQSQELKETVARMNTLADGPTRRTLKAKANSITVALMSFREIYKTLTRMMRQLLQRAEITFGAMNDKLWAHPNAIHARYESLPDHVGSKVSLSMHYPNYYGPYSSIPRSYIWGSLVLAGADRLTK